MENNNNKKDNVAKHCVTIVCTIAVFGAGLLFLSLDQLSDNNLGQILQLLQLLDSRRLHVIVLRQTSLAHHQIAHFYRDTNQPPTPDPHFGHP